MSTDYTLKLRKNYLHVKLPNDYEITPEGVQSQWTEILDICQKNHCRRVFCEGKISKRSLQTIDAFQAAVSLTNLNLGLSIAFCFYDYTPDDLSQFFIDVALNRGARVKFFSNKSDTLKWLDID